jgi:hypothetical protein
MSFYEKLKKLKKLNWILWLKKNEPAIYKEIKKEQKRQIRIGRKIFQPKIK